MIPAALMEYAESPSLRSDTTDTGTHECLDYGHHWTPDTTVGPAEDAPPKPPGKGDSTATRLVRLASAGYRFAQGDDGRAFAVPLHGPAIARSLDGSRSNLGAELAAAYFSAYASAPSKSAMADALGVLHGRAAVAEREQLHLRVARHADSIVIDIGDPTGACIVIDPEGWVVRAEPPVTFRRTELTAALPVPTLAGTHECLDCDHHWTTLGGDLDDLRQLINVTDDAWPLLVGWLLSVLFDLPRPLLYLTGEQGTGKTTAARTIAQLVDPSPAPTRAAPRDLASWVTAASGSQVVALDNLSTIADWLSDALCRASTGEGMVTRALYTDDNLQVFRFRRAVILTAIDAGALRGDLGDRLLPVELEPIPTSRRRTDAELDGELTDHHPAILGALLSLAAKVLAVLPTVQLFDLPRMADFGRLLAALDTVKGWRSLDLYRAAMESVAADVVQGDPIAGAVLELLGTLDGQPWHGTPAELLRALDRHRHESPAWPRTPKALSGALARLTPALRGAGVEVVRRRANGVRTLTLEPVPQVTHQPVRPLFETGQGVGRDDGATPDVLDRGSGGASLPSLASLASPPSRPRPADDWGPF